MSPKVAGLLGVLVVLLLAPASPQNSPDYLYTGQGWLEWEESMQVGWIIGYNAGMSMGMAQAIVPSKQSKNLANNTAISRWARCSANKTTGQMVAILNKYVKDHP